MELFPDGYEYQTDFLRKAYEEGVEIGLKRGIAKGKRMYLLNQLICKFGELDDDVFERVYCSDDLQLERWYERLFTAETLAEMFAED